MSSKTPPSSLFFSPSVGFLLPFLPASEPCHAARPTAAARALHFPAGLAGLLQNLSAGPILTPALLHLFKGKCKKSTIGGEENVILKITHRNLYNYFLQLELLQPRLVKTKSYQQPLFGFLCLNQMCLCVHMGFGSVFLNHEVCPPTSNCERVMHKIKGRGRDNLGP